MTCHVPTVAYSVLVVLVMYIVQHPALHIRFVTCNMR